MLTVKKGEIELNTNLSFESDVLPVFDNLVECISSHFLFRKCFLAGIKKVCDKEEFTDAEIDEILNLIKNKCNVSEIKIFDEDIITSALEEWIEKHYGIDFADI